MVTIGKDHILGINPAADVHLYGQEVNPETSPSANRTST